MISKNFLFGSILAFLMIGLVELGAYVFSVTYEDFFSHEDFTLGRLEGREARYANFLAQAYDSETGWRNRASVSKERTNCRDEKVLYATDAKGARIEPTSVAAPERVQIVVVGDSYTYGVDESAFDTFPAALARLTGARVANQGVSGYGPLQAVLRFEQVAPLYPNADVAILGIMHENIRRMPNAFRPVMYKRSGMRFGFKPYVDVTGGSPRTMNNPNGPAPGSLDEIVGLAKRSFEEDYWAKPHRRFPYTLSLLQSLASAHTQKTKVGGVLVRLGYDEYALDYADPKLRAGLEHVVRRFVSSAHASGMKAIIAFIPNGPRDRHAPDDFLAELESRPEFTRDVAFVRVGSAKADWSEYRPEWTCHPTATGYAHIAKTIHEKMVHRGWLLGNAVQD